MKNKCTKFACAIIIEYFCNIITKGRLDMKLRTAFIFLSILGASLMGHTQNNRNLFRCNPNDIYSLLNEGLQSQLEHRFDKRQVLDPKSTLLSYEEQLWTDGRFVLSTFYNHKARVIQAGFNRFMEPTPGMEKPHELTVAGKKAKVKGNSQLYATVEKLGNYTMLVYRNAQGTPLKAYYKISIDDVNNRTWTIFLHYILDGNYMLSNDENTVFGIKQDFYTGKKYNTDPGIYQFYLHPEDNSIDIEYGEGRVSHGDPSSPKYGKMPGGGGAAAITQKVERVPTRLIAKIAFLAALVCFLFPFMSVSCDASTAASMAGEKGDYSFEIVYNGYNLIFPSTISEKNIKTGSGFDQREKSSTADSGENYGSKEGTNPWLIITAICCIAGSVILFLKRGKLFTLISAGCSLVSLICLIIFRANFTSRYISDGKTDLEGLGNYLKVNTKFGYVLCILMVILALISTLVSYLVEKPKSPQNFY